MRSLTIPDELYDRLAKQAAARNVTVEQLVTRLLDLAVNGEANGSSVPAQAPVEDWNKKFAAWMAEIQARSSRYPAGFSTDVSRESIYEGCGQ